MNDNKKAGAELDAEAMEQVSGGSGDQRKCQYCSNCRKVTLWIKVQGNWVCGNCGRSYTNSPLGD